MKVVASPSMLLAVQFMHVTHIPNLLTRPMIRFGAWRISDVPLTYFIRHSPSGMLFEVRIA